MRIVRAIFYIEVVTNLGSALFALWLPAPFLAQLATEPASEDSVEFVRWYAVVLVVLSLVLLAALREGSDRVLRPVVAAYLAGDALQIAVSIRFGETVGSYGVAVHAALWSSVFYAAVRVYYLRHTRAVGPALPWRLGAVLLVLSVTPLLLPATSPESLKPLISARFPNVRWVDTTTLAAWMQDDPSTDPVLLDVRTETEFEISHLEGATQVDPTNPEAGSIEVEEDARVVVYCSAGYRSAAIVERLHERGIDDVYNLTGGIFAWANEGRPIVRGDETVEAVHPYNALWGPLFLRSELRAAASPRD